MRTTLVALTLLFGCTVPAHTAPVVPQAPHRIYVGSVSRAQGPPIFRYTRDVDLRGDTQLSVHRSYAAADGELVVAQAAEHDGDYALHRYVETHRQLGVTSGVRVTDEGALEFSTHRQGRTRTRSEPARAPAVVGPTLFGFVSRHWADLAEGSTVQVRFVVAERRRSYPFTLRMETSSERPTVVVMTANNPLLRMSVRPMRMTFDPRTRTIVRYEGRVPPRWNKRPLDARVDYEHTAQYQ